MVAMDVKDSGHDHHFGAGADHDVAGQELVGLEAATGGTEHAATTDVHGAIAHFGADVAKFSEALSHLPPPDHVAAAEHFAGGLDHDFGTHHDLADGLHGLHDSIHDAASHLGFDEHHAHGLADAVHDVHHDDPTHHHDHFGLGH